MSIILRQTETETLNASSPAFFMNVCPKFSAYREDFSAIGASLSLGMNDDGAYLFLRYPAGAGEGEGDVS